MFLLTSEIVFEFACDKWCHYRLQQPQTDDAQRGCWILAVAGALVIALSRFIGCPKKCTECLTHSWAANQLIQSGSSSKFKPTIKKLESLTFDNNRPSSDQKSKVLPFCWKRGSFGFHFFCCRSSCNAYCCKTNCCCFTTATHLWGGALSSDSLTFKRRGQRTVLG